MNSKKAVIEQLTGFIPLSFYSIMAYGMCSSFIIWSMALHISLGRVLIGQ